MEIVRFVGGGEAFPLYR